MSTNEILDAFGMFRREMALIRAAFLKDHEFGHLQMLILYLLSKSDSSMGELSEFSMADKASTTRAVASLEKAGLVKRIPHETDRRITMIGLTAKGRAKAEKGVVIRNEIGKRVNGTLTLEERKELARLLIKVAHGLQEKRT